MQPSYRSWIRRFALLSLAVAPVAGAQVTFQHTNQIPLSAIFNFGDVPNGIPQSAYGTNPLSIAYDGTSLYVGGYNSSAAVNTVGVARIDNPLSITTSVSGLASSQFTSPASRGIDSMAASATQGVFMGHDSGLNTTSFVSKIDPVTGAATWTSMSPSSSRVNAIAIDPLANAGAPALSMVSLGNGSTGSGRLITLNASTGTLLFKASYHGGSEPGGPVIAGDGDTSKVAWRGLAFDSAGNMALQEWRFAAYAKRNGNNQFKNINDVLNQSSQVEKKTFLDQNRANNVGSGVALLEGVSGNTMLVSALRAGGDSTIGFSTSYTDFTAGSNNYDARGILIRNVNGTVNGAVQNAILGGEDGIGSAFTGEIRNFAVGKDAENNPVLFVVSLAENRVDIYSLEPTYTGTGQAWDSTSWSGGFAPSTGLHNAKFGSSIAVDTSVALNDARTIKNLKFDNAAAKYTINGTGSLTLTGPDAWGGNIQVLAGIHTVAVPVILAKSANFTVINAADKLTITGDISAAGKGVTKRGAGTAVVKNLRLSALALRGGTLTIASNGSASGTSSTGTLTIDGATDAWTSSLDLTNNAIVIGSSPIADLFNQIKSGYASGAWTGQGIRSSAAAASAAPAKGALAYAEKLVGVAAPAVFNQVTVADGSTMVMYTLAGDATMDRKVNTEDFNVLAGNFGSGDVWVKGDFNYDNTVESTDFNLLVGNFGASLPASAPTLGSVVPEPASLSVIGFGLSAMLMRRRK